MSNKVTRLSLDFAGSDPHGPNSVSQNPPPKSGPGDHSRTQRSQFASAILCAALFACGAEPGLNGKILPDDSEALAQRAYVVSHDSDELTVIDLAELEVVARVPTYSAAAHMAELSQDLTKIYLTSTETNETVIVDARRLEVTKRLRAGQHPTHLATSRDGRWVVVMNEEESTISFLDTREDVEVKKLPGFHIPHFIRFSANGRFGYVANLGADHLTRVDLTTLEVDRTIPLDGAPITHDPADGEEFGFADAQIDSEGVLYAAHRGSGRVLVYDTRTEQKLDELKVGKAPWVAFAEHPFKNLPLRHLVPNFGDQTVSLIEPSPTRVLATLPGDEEAYGVNFSSQAPERAFVMNRVRQDIAIVDTTGGSIVGRIPVGGNTETAATTADGKWILATVSSANRVVVIEAATGRVVKMIENVGRYPWSITIPRGQNYCH